MFARGQSINIVGSVVGYNNSITNVCFGNFGDCPSIEFKDGDLVVEQSGNEKGEKSDKSDKDEYTIEIKISSQHGVKTMRSTVPRVPQVIFQSKCELNHVEITNGDAQFLDAVKAETVTVKNGSMKATNVTSHDVNVHNGNLNVEGELHTEPTTVKNGSIQSRKTVSKHSQIRF